MKQATIAKLDEAMRYCDEHDKSTEFMLQYMQDAAGVSFDCVMSYLEHYAPKPETDGGASKLAREVWKSINVELQAAHETGISGPCLTSGAVKLIEAHDAALLASHGQGAGGA